MKKIFILLFSVIFATFLTACGVSKEVKNVIEKIDSLQEITLESEPILNEINMSYQALSDKEKEQVTNLPILESAKEQYNLLVEEEKRKQKNQSIIEEMNNNLHKLNREPVSKAAELEEMIKTIKAQYTSLDDDYKTEATEYYQLDSYIANCVKKTVVSLATGGNSTVSTTFLSKYKEYLNSSDLLSCLGEIGLQSCINDAKSTLMRINSGKVFSITSVNAFCTDEMGYRTSYQTGENQVEGTINISGINYFGGPYTQEISMYYSFTVNMEKCSVTDVNGFTF